MRRMRAQVQGCGSTRRPIAEVPELWRHGDRASRLQAVLHALLQRAVAERQHVEDALVANPDEAADKARVVVDQLLLVNSG